MFEVNSKIFVLVLSIFLLFQVACQRQNAQNIVNKTLPTETSNTAKLPMDKPEPTPSNAKEESPISIGAVSVEASKPPLVIYSFEIDIKSRRSDYKWLLMRYFPQKPLAKNNTFYGWKDGRLPFSVDEYFGKGEKAVLINFSGEDGFRAIRLPEKDYIKFKPLVFFGSAGATEFEAWEVRSLLVNGVTPLEKWLPFDTHSTSTIIPIDSQRMKDRKSLDDDQTTLKTRTDFPKEEVKYVMAEGVRKWSIPFNIRTSDSK